MKNAVAALLAVALILGFVWFVWMWGFCRLYVPPDHMAIVKANVGKALDPGRILARAGEQGVREEVLGEGRYFLNPILYDWEIRPVLVIPPGKVGVVTSKVGRDLPQGEFLAEPDQKGIWRRVLGPGKYRLNPYGYEVSVTDAVSVPIGYAGVVTSLAGEQAPPGQFAEAGQKGVGRDVLQPGLYYINPKRFKVDIVEIGVNQVSLLGRTGGEVLTKGQLETQNVAMEQLQSKAIEEQRKKRLDYFSNVVDSLQRGAQRSAPRGQVSEAAQADAAQQAQTLEKMRRQYVEQGQAMPTLMLAEFLEFPSRDGFQISLDMTVEVELLPQNIAGIFSAYGDLPAVVDKIILPQITSIARNKGSEYGAKDFIVGEGREKFQAELTKTLAATLAQKQIVVHNALIRHVEVPGQILQPIQDASIAVEQNLTNIERQNTAKKLAELNTERTLIEQRRQQVAQETLKLKAEIKADEEKQAAELRAEAVKQVAQIARQTAVIEANTVRTLAEAEAAAVRLVEGEKAKGLQLKAKAFGDPSAYALWTLAQGLSDKLRIQVLHAGEGTLWTDLQKAALGDLGGAAILREAGRK